MSGTQPSAGSTPNTPSPAQQEMGSTAPPPPARRRSPAILIAIIVVVIVVVAVVGYGAYAGWFKTSSSSSSTGYPSCSSGTPSLTGAGSTFVYPIMSLWSYNFAQATGSCAAEVSYNAVGSGAGITDFTDKLVDYGATDAPPNFAQVGAFPAPALVMPDSMGAVTVLFNLKGIASGTLNLTGNIVAEIYLGNITNWDNPQITAINPHLTLPNATILPVARSDGSGTSFAFSGFLTLDNTYWAAKYGQNLLFPTLTGVTYEKGSTGVAGFVASNPDSIGYAELNYAKTSGVSYAAVANPTGAFIVPSVATTAPAAESVGSSLPAGSGNWSSVSILNQPGATTYPIATLTYILIYHDLATLGSSFTLNDAEWLVAFLHYIVTTGQNDASALFYVPLPSSITANANATISSIVYNGASIPTYWS